MKGSTFAQVEGPVEDDPASIDNKKVTIRQTGK